ncbi:hypothetical protein FHT39_002269 [Mitsuaria sp. BK045]|nr:hypothetical protein [Mitsuaria sp. BK041]MBB3362847.1 hypothetical protein [Mitsuaria sp. BK045]
MDTRQDTTSATDPTLSTVATSDAGGLLVGCAAGFSGDRTDAARPVVDTLIRLGGPAVLIFETLAERTLALAQLARQRDPEAGYEPLLDEMLRPVLADCLAHRIPIVGNFGAANPPAAARRVAAIAAELGLRPPVVAVVAGDALVSPDQRARLAAALKEDGPPLPDGAIASANVYLGAEGIAEALRRGADVVVTGRVADPSLTVGPALAHFGWALDDWDRLAGATMAGHLLECGAQVCGGYYADPGFKDVPDLSRVGFPIARIDADGACTIFKADGTGGRLDTHTVKEQLLYELHDPAAYLTPDVVADISAASVTPVGPDAVRLDGVRGHPRPATFKANVFFANGWLAEGEISYAGPGAEARARLAGEVLRARLDARDRQGPLRIDLIGVTSVLGDDAGDALRRRAPGDASDVRLRVAANHPDRAGADRLTREVTALYTCGPAGGGGVRTNLRPRLGLRSCLFPREHAPATVTLSSDGNEGAVTQSPDGSEGVITRSSAGSEGGWGRNGAWGSRRDPPCPVESPRLASRPAASAAPTSHAAHPAPEPSTPTRQVELRAAAHGRTGDKGDRSNISVIAWHPALYPLLVEQLTEDAVARQFASRRPTRVTRHLLPRLGAINFVLDGVLDGGVNDALNLDSHGKALSFVVLAMPLMVPETLVPWLRGPGMDHNETMETA